MTVKLSVVIVCWNDSKCILDCIQSVYTETPSLDFEVIVTDNASTDRSVECIRERFPGLRIVENGANLGFGRGNNVGIGLAKGDYILLLNADTVVHNRGLETWVTYADRHPNAGAFGCRTLNEDGSLQHTAQPAPTVLGYLISALCLRWLARFSNRFLSDVYVDWDGRTERNIGFQAGCSLMVRGKLLKALGGFDERFFHQFEDADLCRRIWRSGRSVIFCPKVEITHIGGQKRGSYPIEVILETERSKYRYFSKHYGRKGLVRIRRVSLVAFGLRYLAYRIMAFVVRNPALKDRLRKCRALLNWHWRLNPITFIENGAEPDSEYDPLKPIPNVANRVV